MGITPSPASANIRMRCNPSGSHPSRSGSGTGRAATCSSRPSSVKMGVAHSRCLVRLFAPVVLTAEGTCQTRTAHIRAHGRDAIAGGGRAPTLPGRWPERLRAACPRRGTAPGSSTLRAPVTRTSTGIRSRGWPCEQIAVQPLAPTKFVEHPGSDGDGCGHAGGSLCPMLDGVLLGMRRARQAPLATLEPHRPGSHVLPAAERQPPRATRGRDRGSRGWPDTCAAAGRPPGSGEDQVPAVPRGPREHPGERLRFGVPDDVCQLRPTALVEAAACHPRVCGGRDAGRPA